MVARGAEAVLRANGRVLGVVLNRLARSARSYYYYYDSYAYYYENDEDGDQGGSPPKRKERRTQQKEKTSGAKNILVAQPQSLFDSKLISKAEVNGLYKIQIDPNKPI
jgi:hypothetical protein